MKSSRIAGSGTTIRSTTATSATGNTMVARTLNVRGLAAALTPSPRYAPGCS